MRNTLQKFQIHIWRKEISKCIKFGKVGPNIPFSKISRRGWKFIPFYSFFWTDLGESCQLHHISLSIQKCRHQSPFISLKLCHLEKRIKRSGTEMKKKKRKKRSRWEIARAAWSVILADDFEGGARQNCRVLRRPKLAARVTNRTAVTQNPFFSFFSLRFPGNDVLTNPQKLSFLRRAPRALLLSL